MNQLNWRSSWKIFQSTLFLCTKLIWRIIIKKKWVHLIIPCRLRASFHCKARCMNNLKMCHLCSNKRRYLNSNQSKKSKEAFSWLISWEMESLAEQWSERALCQLSKKQRFQAIKLRLSQKITMSATRLPINNKKLK